MGYKKPTPKTCKKNPKGNETKQQKQFGSLFDEQEPGATNIYI